MAVARRWTAPVAVFAAIVLFILYEPWVKPPDSARPALTVLFWLATIAMGLLFVAQRNDPGVEVVEVEAPALTRFLFNTTRAGWFWLAVRLFVGSQWIQAGWGKLTGHGWTDGGASLLGFWKNAVSIPDTGRPPITFEWYRTFLQWLIDNGAQGWFAWLITLGELAVGIGLVVGALTGVAAFFGATMNMSYMLAGSSSTNPILFAMLVGLMLAWRVAGYYGVDRYLLPLLGVPWTRKKVTVAAPGRSGVSAT
jgi:thiosulfate dehydrogenase [quinone] large subunit